MINILKLIFIINYYYYADNSSPIQDKNEKQNVDNNLNFYISQLKEMVNDEKIIQKLLALEKKWEKNNENFTVIKSYENKSQNSQFIQRKIQEIKQENQRLKKKLFKIIELLLLNHRDFLMNFYKIIDNYDAIHLKKDETKILIGNYFKIIKKYFPNYMNQGMVNDYINIKDNNIQSILIDIREMYLMRNNLEKNQHKNSFSLKKIIDKLLSRK
jgi:hypothetical protein